MTTQAASADTTNTVPSYAQTVLPDGGWCGVIDFMGDEQRILEAARTSSRDVLPGEPVDLDPAQIERDERLIHYLLSHGHWSVFDQVKLQMIIHLPITIARQWMRHWSWDYNEKSGRYSEVRHDVWVPTSLRLQNTTGNKQGSDRPMVPAPTLAYQADSSVQEVTNEAEIAKAQRRQDELLAGWKTLADATHEYYNLLLSAGVARELARGVLPQFEMTTLMATVSLRDLIMFCSKRNHPDAQKEIQFYAVYLESVWAQMYPRVYQAYLLHMQGAVTIPAHALPFLDIKRNHKKQRTGLGVRLNAAGQKAADEVMGQVSRALDVLERLPYGRETQEYPEGTPAPLGMIPAHIKARWRRILDQDLRGALSGGQRGALRVGDLEVSVASDGSINIRPTSAEPKPAK